MKGLFLLFVLVCAAYVHGESVNHSFNYLLNVSIRFVKKKTKKTGNDKLNPPEESRMD